MALLVFSLPNLSCYHFSFSPPLYSILFILFSNDFWRLLLNKSQMKKGPCDFNKFLHIVNLLFLLMSLGICLFKFACTNNIYIYIYIYIYACSYLSIYLSVYLSSLLVFFFFFPLFSYLDIISHFYTHLFSGCPRGVMVKAMDCGIVVSEFVLQSRYYVHFRANTLGKGMNPLILPATG